MPQAVQGPDLEIEVGFRYTIPYSATRLWNPSANDAVIAFGGSASNSEQRGSMRGIRCRYNGRTALTTSPFNSSSGENVTLVGNKLIKLVGDGTGNAFYYREIAFPDAFGDFTLPLQPQFFLQLPSATNDFSGIGMCIATLSDAVSMSNPGGTGAGNKQIFNSKGARVATPNVPLGITSFQRTLGTNGDNKYSHVCIGDVSMFTLSINNNEGVNYLTWECRSVNPLSSVPMTVEAATLDDATFNTALQDTGNSLCCGGGQGFFVMVANTAPSFPGMNRPLIWVDHTWRTWRRVHLRPLDNIAATELARNAGMLATIGRDGRLYWKNNNSTGGANIFASPLPPKQYLPLSVFRHLPRYGHFDVPPGVKTKG